MSHSFPNDGMLNVFLINSYLTYVVARLVIEKEGYPSDRSVFVFMRGVKPLNASRYKACELECRIVENQMPVFPTYLKFYKGRKLKADLFRQMRSFTSGEKFRLHVFQTNSRVVQLIRSMPECVETHILEEGSCVYHYSFEELTKLYLFPISDRVKFYNRLNYGNSIKDPGFIEGDLHCYCLFEEAFRGAPNKTPLFDLDKVIQILRPQVRIESDSVLFIHTWFDEERQVAELMNVYAALVLQMAKQYEGRPLYHRFHPAQNEKHRSIIRRKLEKNGLEVKELPASEPIENYVFSPHPFTFVGWDSSVLYYAKRMGKEVIVASE